MSEITSHLKGNVVAYLALFVALGGTALAASKITSAEIKNDTVKSKDLKDNSATGRDVKDSTLESGDVKDSTLESGDVKDGSLLDADLAANGVTGLAVDESSLTGVPRLAGQIDSNGDVLFAEGLGGATVTHPSAAYCFNNLSFTPQVVVASPVNFAVPLVFAGGPVPGCPDADATVTMYDPPTGTAQDSRFYVFMR